MPTSVNVQGVGVINFPDSMSQEDIQKALQGRSWEQTPEHGALYSAADKLLNAPLPSEQYRSNGDGILDSARNALLDFGDSGANMARGVAKGAISTAAGLGSIANRYLGASIPVNQENLKGLTETHGVAQGIGNAAEQVGEFMSGEWLAKAATKAPLLANIAAKSKLANKGIDLASRVMANGAVSAAQSGGDPTSTMVGASMPVVGDAVGAAWNKGKDFIQKAGGGKKLSAEAQALAAQNSIPLRQSDLNGSAVTRAAEGVAGHSTAMDIYQAQEPLRQEWLNKAAKAISGTDTGEPVSNDLMNQLKDLTGKYRDEANQHYTDFRKAADSTNQSVQVGTQPSQVVNASGQNFQVPVYKTLATPVDLTQVKATMAPAYERMKAIKAEFPSYDFGEGGVQLADIMNASDHVPADVADKHLSSLKRLTRDAALPTVMNESQGLASKAIGHLEPELQNALSTMNPAAQQSLLSGRQATQSKYAIADLIKDVSGNKEGDISKTVMNRLLAPGDYNVESHLAPVVKALPAMKDKIGSAALNDLFSQPTREGGFERVAGVLKRWDDMGPKTKDLLYGPQKTKEIDNFLELAGRMNWNVNPSGTGKFGVVRELMHNPVAKLVALGSSAAAAGHYLAISAPAYMAGVYASRQLGRILLEPGAPNKLRDLIKFGVNSAQGKLARAMVSKVLSEASSSQEN